MNAMEEALLKGAGVFAVIGFSFLMAFLVTGNNALILLAYGDIVVTLVLLSFFFMTRYGGR